jgi:Tol biopolymer transport system component
VLSTRPLTAAVAVALLIGLGVVSSVGAEPPGRDGPIAFMERDPSGHWQVWTGTATLSAQRQLTHADADSGWPVWSPDGSQIAFDSNRADPNPNDKATINDIYVMSADGSHVRKLTDSQGASADAAFSPDGTLIAFDADRGHGRQDDGIYVMKARNGSALRRITTLPAYAESDAAPRFSPDGKHIAFTRYRVVDGAELSALMIVRANGTNLKRLTNWNLRVGDADWSPDGSRLTFETNYAKHGNHPADIYVIDATGAHLTNLTHNHGATGSGAHHRLEFSSDPVWSPDAETILFLDGTVTTARERAGLATIQPNATDRHFILNNPDVEMHQPDWEPLRRRP